MSKANERRRQILLMYLDFATKDLERGRAIPKRFADELKRWGHARLDQIDRRNAIQLIPLLEGQGIVGDEKFAEVAKRLERFKGKDPDERLIRKWWEERNKPGIKALLPDEILTRRAGRPKRAK